MLYKANLKTGRLYITIYLGYKVETIAKKAGSKLQDYVKQKITGMILGSTLRKNKSKRIE